MTLEEATSAQVTEKLRRHFKKAVKRAEENASEHWQDEDALTGALGERMISKGKIEVPADGGRYVISVSSKKLRGRGIGAEEKLLGADFFMSIVVKRSGKVVYQKGLPAQAKKVGNSDRKGAVKQAETMMSTLGTGLIVQYTQDGYRAMPAEEFVHSDFDRVSETRDTLGDWMCSFTDCKIGKENLSIDEVAEVVKGQLTLIETQVEVVR